MRQREPDAAAEKHRRSCQSGWPGGRTASGGQYHGHGTTSTAWVCVASLSVCVHISPPGLTQDVSSLPHSALEAGCTWDSSLAQTRNGHPASNLQGAHAQCALAACETAVGAMSSSPRLEADDGYDRQGRRAQAIGATGILGKFGLFGAPWQRSARPRLGGSHHAPRPGAALFGIRSM